MSNTNWCRLTILIVILSMYIGGGMGRNHAIEQAELLSVNDTEYCIAFGEEVQVYTYESEAE